MKEREMKLFGIGAGALMILLAFVPAVYGAKRNEGQPPDMPKDLSITLNFCNYKRLSIDRLYAIYDINYTILNLWTHGMNYVGWIILKNGEGLVIDQWWVIFVDDGAGGQTYSHLAYVRSTDDTDVDMERHYAGTVISIQANFQDDNPSNDIDYGVANYFNGETGNCFTEPQSLVSTVAKYMNISIDGQHYYYDFSLFNPDNFPPLLKARMGWTLELVKNLKNISEDIITILIAGWHFFNATWDDFRIILFFIGDVTWYITQVIYGFCDPDNFYILLDQFITLVLPAAFHILQEAAFELPIILLAAQSLYNHCITFENWKETEPWLQPITICGTISDVKNNEVVTVTCRYQEYQYQDENHDGKIEFNFTVASTPLSEIPPSGYSWIDPWPHQQWWIHDCTIVVAGSKHLYDKQSIRLLSFAFSKGTVSWNHCNLNEDDIPPIPSEPVQVQIIPINGAVHTAPVNGEGQIILP